MAPLRLSRETAVADGALESVTRIPSPYHSRRLCPDRKVRYRFPTGSVLPDVRREKQLHPATLSGVPPRKQEQPSAAEACDAAPPLRESLAFQVCTRCSSPPRRS